ncbi:winged helix-turn-helix transcriptional regulator [Nitrososphaera viennensis]|uniref:winged helix-turn-helix transcriptional regulator n=1 Tax=Nitrososphaera viennensis TaxID=1034015 RepID=UPI0009464B95
MKRDRRNFYPSLRVISKILRILLENPTITRTDLCQKAGLNYSRFLNHLDWLGQKGIIELKLDSCRVVVTLTKNGREFTMMLNQNNIR